MSLLRREWHYFLLALQFFTRIPVPASTPYSEAALNASSRYFPLVGLLVGGLCAAVIWLALFAFALPVAIFLGLLASLLITGGFHEDGLADFADGMGGGWEREKILTIMQDSRLGTFGALTLIMALGGKFLLLFSLPLQWLLLLLIAGHGVSRLSAVSMLLTESYARENGKAKPLATAMNLPAFLFAAATATLPFFFLPPLFLLAVLPLLPLRLWFAHWLRRWLGGFTGDCLGALQQLSELLFLLGAVSLCRFI
ncbi:MAG: adenosylcobinamide-GDP ribazoletransferase [Pedobacter sp.]|nr:adenosylcobinamide-GDP ribazoletransferase [Pedobacter sp.]